jgi:hypothetical protein
VGDIRGLEGSHHSVCDRLSRRRHPVEAKPHIDDVAAQCSHGLDASTAAIDAANRATIKELHGVGASGPEPGGSAARTKRMTSSMS